MRTSNSRKPLRVSPITRGITIACVLAATSLAVRAQAGPDRPDQGQWWMIPQVVERLGLSTEQVQEIDTIAFDTGRKMIDLRAEQQKAQLELHRLLRQDSVDESQMTDSLSRLEDAQCRITSLETRSRIQIAMMMNGKQRMQILRRLEAGERTRPLKEYRERLRQEREERESRGR